jgi:lipid A 3-O-deacylase
LINLPVAAPRAAIFLAALSFAAFLGFAPSPAAAQGLVDEIKLGVLDHDIGIFGHHKESGADINLELLFGSPAFLKFIGAPRPHIGMDVNSDDNTNQFYLGLTWNGDLISSVLGKSDAIYVQGSLGGAIHDGETEGVESATQKRLGSRLLFRESAEFGWRYSPGQSIGIFMDHISNASLAEHNDGLTSLGVRLGYKF